MHLPGRVLVIGRTTHSEWAARELWTPLGRPMMKAFCFRPTGGKPFGQSPDYRRIQSASPQPYIDSIQAHGKLFSGATGVPLNSLGIVQDNPASAEAIAAQREDICVAAEDCIESNREAMLNVAIMAMAVGNNTTPDGLTAEQLSVVPYFKNPMRPSLAATADAMIKVAGVLDGFAQTREFLANMGFTPTEVESVRSQLDAAANQRALMSIMGGAKPAEGGE